jgi:hypothetical protein
VAERSKIEQVKSGFRIAAWIVGSMAVIILLGKGESWMLAPDRPQERLLGIGVTGVVAAVLYLTARIWAKWFIGYCIYRVLWAPFYLLKEKSINWVQVAEFAAAWAIVIALGYRFISQKPRPLESLGLTILIASLTWAAVSSTVLPAMSGISLLAIVRFTIELERRRHKRSQVTAKV